MDELQKCLEAFFFKKKNPLWQSNQKFRNAAEAYPADLILLDVEAYKRN